jgi:hypothetical protein
VAFVQGAGKKTPAIGTIDCWHCSKKGHYKTSCPELQIDKGVQNLSIKDSVQKHSLFLTDDDYKMLQKEETGVCRRANGLELTNPSAQNSKLENNTSDNTSRGIHGILLPHYMYINTCASYASIPYPHLLKNLKKEERTLMGHSNMGSGGMDMSGKMGAVEQMWLMKEE